MKNTQLLALLLFPATVGFGQGRDTVLAVHKLFAQKRGSGAGWASVGASVATGESIGWPTVWPTPENAAVAALYGGVPMAIGALRQYRFSSSQEAIVIKSYQEGWSIPPDIRRRLRRKHFHLTARDLGQR